MSESVLIANRGEIACRIALACKRLNLRSVGIVAPADLGSLHARSVDMAVYLSGSTLQETYLNIQQIIEIAKKHDCKLIHPGYGFLSESATFAQAVKDAGLTFIGPTPKTIGDFGDKIRAKQIAKEAGVPTLESYSLEDDNSNAEKLKGFLQKNPFPLLVKAAGGGGGRGMKLVSRHEDLDQAIKDASREAKAYFADSRVFIERYLPGAKHIEVQIAGDTQQEIRTLFERECSFQRSHQKVVEEAPSTITDDKTRQAILDAALALARQAGYLNLGTVEFLLSQQGEFFFLEANSRLQVEHPVTESITGIDLVALQIKIAKGFTLEQLLGEKDQSLPPHGHAIECRICAEDPYNNFQAGAGTITSSNLNTLQDQYDWIRLDAGYEQGDQISAEYDSLVAKLIVHGKDRSQAISRMTTALENSDLQGIPNNIGLLKLLIDSEPFRDGSYHVQSLPTLLPTKDTVTKLKVYAAAIAYLAEIKKSDFGTPPFRLFGTARQSKLYSVNAQQFKLNFKVVTPDVLECSSEIPETIYFEVKIDRSNWQLCKIDGVSYGVRIFHGDSGTIGVNLGPLGPVTIYEMPLTAGKESEEKKEGSLELRSPLPGRILKLNVSVGDKVEPGQSLAVLESMKMEHPLKASSSSTVAEILVKEGSLIEADTVVIRFKMDE